MAIFHLEASLTAGANAVSIADSFHKADIAPAREFVSGISQVSVSSAQDRLGEHDLFHGFALCHLPQHLGGVLVLSAR